MQQADDGLKVEVAEFLQTLIGPAPVGAAGFVGFDALPEYRIAEACDQYPKRRPITNEVSGGNSA